MTKKYQSVRIPFEAKEWFGKKQEVLKEIAKEEKLPVKITFADTLRFYSQKSIPVYNAEVINFVNQSKKRARRIKYLLA